MELLGNNNMFRLIGDMLHLVSVMIVLLKMLRHRTAHGLSLKSQFAYAVVFTTRYVPSLIFMENRSWYLLVMKLFYLSTSWYIVFLIRFRNPWKASYNWRTDSFKMRYLFIPSSVLALLLHYDRPHLVEEILWTFSQYLEAVAIMPQLLLLFKVIEDGGKWELLTGHYVFTLGMYRLFYIFNWIYRYWVEDRWNAVDTTAGVVQTLLFTDFFWTYVKGMAKLRAENLPLLQ
eukprot:TRINITY_DN5221_c0_g1_i1.p1 TRINITY_DN5221_c0_g1~~TRINITY_DN5221_c0_g1_i1.p1  ORF type:complete len:231 (+),score=49.15 TRINITY_DN5221_c0_g1_i1:64-756(+)